MLKEYVCGHCLGRGNVWDEVETEGKWYDVPVPCPLCVAKHFPPKVVLPFEGPPATSELVVEVKAQQPVGEQIRLQPTGTADAG